MVGKLHITISLILVALLSVGIVYDDGSPLRRLGDRQLHDIILYSEKEMRSNTPRELKTIKSTIIHTPPPLPPPLARTAAPPRVAVGFHGDYLRKISSRLGKNIRQGGCSDAFLHWESQLRDVVGPLNASERIYVSTTRSNCVEADEALVELIRPRAINLGPPRSNIATSYAEVLELIMKDAADLDAFVLVRFDLKYRHNISSLGVDWGAFNYAFRDVGWKEGFCHMTSDLFFAAPISYAKTLHDAAVWSMEMNKARIVDPQTGKKCSVSGGMHFTFDRIAIADGDNQTKFHFLDNGFHPSMPEVDRGANRQVAALDRRCGKWALNCSRIQSTT